MAKFLLSISFMAVVFLLCMTTMVAGSTPHDTPYARGYNAAYQDLANSSSMAVADPHAAVASVGPLSAALHGSYSTVLTCVGAVLLVSGVMLATMAAEQPAHKHSSAHLRRRPRFTPLRAE